MALTKIHSPQSIGIEYVFNPFYFEYSSTNSGKLNFKYIADVFCSDASQQSFNTNDIYVGRFKFPMRPDNQHGIFSPSRVLENLVYNRFSADTQIILKNQYPLLEYVIQFGEEYDSSATVSGATGTTIYSALTGFAGFAMNAVKQYDSPAISNTYPLNFRYLSDWNFTADTKSIKPNEVETLQFIYLIQSAVTLGHEVVTTRDYSGGTNAFTASTIFDGSARRWEIPSGTYNIGITDPNIISYNILLVANTGAILGPASGINYSIDYVCSRFDNIRLNWLSKLGGYDYFTFTLKHYEQINRKNFEWERFLSYDYSVGDRGRTNLYIDNTQKIVLTTDWLNDSQSEFIRKMFASPEINWIKYYQESDTYQTIPLQLVTQSFEKQNKLNNVLVQYTLEFEQAQNIWAQRT